MPAIKYQKLCSGEVFPTSPSTYSSSSYGDSNFDAYSGTERLEKYFLEARLVEVNDNQTTNYVTSIYGY